MTCVVCRFISFWDTICDTPFVFLLRILHRFSRSSPLVGLWSSFYQSTYEHLIAVSHPYLWLVSYSWLFHLRNQQCSAVPLVDNLQCYPQLSFVDPASDILPPFGWKSQTLPVAWLSFLRRRGSVRGLPLSWVLLLTILYGVQAPQIFLLTKNYQNLIVYTS